LVLIKLTLVAQDWGLRDDSGERPMVLTIAADNEPNKH
jgi:hypothetical protein